MRINIKYKRKNAFTFIEILFISILISAGLLFIANSIRHAKEVNYKIIQSVIANQLATEWVEIVYQLRNTNFLQYETLWINDKRIINSCRLAHNFNECYDILKQKHGLNLSIQNWHLFDDYENNLFLKTWYYYITNNWWINELHNCNLESDKPENCSKIAQDIYSICQIDWSWIPCTSWHEANNDESNYWHFYRYIEWIGNYNMDSTETWWTILSPEYFPADKDAQEYRFCSRVYRQWMQWWEVEICSTMTNFID